MLDTLLKYHEVARSRKSLISWAMSFVRVIVFFLHENPWNRNPTIHQRNSLMHLDFTLPILQHSNGETSIYIITSNPKIAWTGISSVWRNTFIYTPSSQFFNWDTFLKIQTLDMSNQSEQHVFRRFSPTFQPNGRSGKCGLRGRAWRKQVSKTLRGRCGENVFRATAWLGWLSHWVGWFGLDAVGLGWVGLGWMIGFLQTFDELVVGFAHLLAAPCDEPWINPTVYH